MGHHSCTAPLCGWSLIGYLLQLRSITVCLRNGPPAEFWDALPSCTHLQALHVRSECGFAPELHPSSEQLLRLSALSALRQLSSAQPCQLTQLTNLTLYYGFGDATAVQAALSC
jgi:hypothetical protein